MQKHHFFEGGELPQAYELCKGLVVTFNTDFRAWLKYEYLQGCTVLSEAEKYLAILEVCFDKSCKDPADIEPGRISEALNWFYSRGDSERMAKISVTPIMAEKMRERPRHSCLYWDFYQIWASFKKQHKIDLYTCETLHWWEFRRLFDELDGDTALGLLRWLRRVSRDEFEHNEKAMKNLRGKEWALLELDKLMAAIPE